MYATAVRNRTSAVRTCEHRITPRYCNWTIAIIAIDGLWFFLDKFTKKDFLIYLKDNYEVINHVTE